MKFVRLVVAMLAEFAVVYLGVDSVKNGTGAVDIALGAAILLVGSIFVLKSIESDVLK